MGEEIRGEPGSLEFGGMVNFNKLDFLCFSLVVTNGEGGVDLIADSLNFSIYSLLFTRLCALDKSADEILSIFTNLFALSTESYNGGPLRTNVK